MTTCPDDELEPLLALAAQDDEAAIGRIDALLPIYEDARLLFLKGSLLAGLQRYDEARREMHAALLLSPGFDLARFQFGFLEFTSGFPDAAAQIWAPFQQSSEENAFRLLAMGLMRLAEDRWADARRFLLNGMALNTEHPLINNDMQLILDELHDKGLISDDGLPQEESATSPVDQLLLQAQLRAVPGETRH
ncbi:MAG: hypothetical protein JSS55_06280 [Proteobacteria bacterium]|nr:hypothetical protein [Pseudomonadota bacterium]